MLTTTRTPVQQDAEPAPGMALASPDPSGAHLAADIRDALRAAWYVPEDDVDVEVRNHAVLLTGMVKWEHQRVAAGRAVEHLAGVHAFKNAIGVMPRVSASEIQAKILATLQYGRSASDHRIDVDVDDEAVTLTGAVESYADRQLAEHAALAVPHVRSVRNQLQIVRT